MRKYYTNWDTNLPATPRWPSVRPGSPGRDGETKNTRKNMLTEKSDLSVLSRELGKKVAGLLGVYALLLGGTVLIILALIGLCAAGVRAVIVAGRFNPWGIALCAVSLTAAGACVKYVLVPLSRVFHRPKENGMEIRRDEFPQFFSIIREIASRIGCRPPVHVYLTEEYGAYVIYTSLWGYLLLGRHDLTIGIPFMFGMNKTELKAVIAHELGHFAQDSSLLNRLANLSISLGSAISGVADKKEKAPFFASLATRIMKRRYLGLLPLGAIHSRAQEYDADYYSYEIAGTEGSLSALCKLGCLGEYFSRKYMAVLIWMVDRKLLPEDAYDLLRRCSAVWDTVATYPLVPSSHHAALPEVSYSRICFEDNLERHPTNVQRFRALASYPLRETLWDDEPAYDLFPDVVVKGMFELLVSSLAARRSTDTDRTAWERVRGDGQSDLPWDVLHVFEIFFQDKFFFDRYLLDRVCLTPYPVPFPFTRKNTFTLKEFRTARVDFLTLVEVMKESSPARRYLYDGEEYTGTHVPIAQHRQLCLSLYRQAYDIAFDCHRWILQNTEYNEGLAACYNDMVEIAPVSFELESMRTDMEKVDGIYRNGDDSTEVREFCSRVTEKFRTAVWDFFWPWAGGNCMFGWMARNGGMSDVRLTRAGSYITRPSPWKEKDAYEVYLDVAFTFSGQFQHNWGVLQKELILPYYIAYKGEIDALDRTDTPDSNTP